MNPVRLVPLGDCPACGVTYEPGEWTARRCQPLSARPPWCSILGIYLRVVVS